MAFDDGRVAGKEPRAAWRPLAGRPLMLWMSAVWPAHSGHPAAAPFARIAAEVIAREDPPNRLLTPPEETGRPRPRPWSVVFEPGAGPAIP
ncbi:hypothetical protein GCM10017744_043380 [Streptomyces antimycoticus]